MLVGKKAPDFTSPAVLDGNRIVSDFSLSQFRNKKDVLLFFYPKDFTFVCPTEIISFQQALSAFQKRGVEVIGVSTDTEETHLAWLSTAKERGGIEGVTYPIVADTSKVIAYNYGVLGGDWDYTEEGDIYFKGLPIAYRGTFLIDRKGIIRHESVNDLPLGRNTDEYLRLVDAMHHADEHGDVCPANWAAGKESIKPTAESTADYLAKM